MMIRYDGLQRVFCLQAVRRCTINAKRCERGGLANTNLTRYTYILREIIHCWAMERMLLTIQ
jgi:hypothetical protein